MSDIIIKMKDSRKFETFSESHSKRQDYPRILKKLNGVCSFSIPYFLGTYFGYRAENLMVIVPMFHTGGIRPKEMQDQLLFSKQHFSFCNFFLFPYNCVYFYWLYFLALKVRGNVKKILRGKCGFFDVSKPSRKELHFEVQL